MPSMLSVPAGRCVRRSPEEKWIDPQPDKGLLQMLVEDDLMHLWWKTRDGNTRHDELIIFPGEATFEAIPQDPTGRTHVLKFSSSDQKYFFWLQRADQTTYEASRADINRLLEDPSHRPQPVNRPGYVAPPRSAAAPGTGGGASTTAAAAPPAAPPVAGASTAGVGATASTDLPAGMQDLASRLLQYVEARQSGNVPEDARLTDIITPGNVSRVLSSRPELVSSLTADLPESIRSANPTLDDILPIVSNPVFTSTAASIENALRNGGLPETVMRDMGMPPMSGENLTHFLDALRALREQEEANGDGASGGGDREGGPSGGDDNMDTD